MKENVSELKDGAVNFLALFLYSFIYNFIPVFILFHGLSFKGLYSNYIIQNTISRCEDTTQ